MLSHATLTAVAALLIIPATAASASPPHHHRAWHRADVFRHSVGRPYGYGYGYGGGTVAPQNPRYGYSESPYDPSYRGPGWEVFAAQHSVEQNATVLHEIAPDAKISATGIVVGGE